MPTHTGTSASSGKPTAPVFFFVSGASCRVADVPPLTDTCFVKYTPFKLHEHANNSQTVYHLRTERSKPQMRNAWGLGVESDADGRAAGYSRQSSVRLIADC